MDTGRDYSMVARPVTVAEIAALVLQVSALSMQQIWTIVQYDGPNNLGLGVLQFLAERPEFQKTCACNCCSESLMLLPPLPPPPPPLLLLLLLPLPPLLPPPRPRRRCCCCCCRRVTVMGLRRHRAFAEESRVLMQGLDMPRPVRDTRRSRRCVHHGLANGGLRPAHLCPCLRAERSEVAACRR